MEKERIQFAAIFRNDNHIIFGRDHAECIKKSPYGTCKNMGPNKNCEMGFLTNHKRFVSREEAAKIAYFSNQIDKWKEEDVIFSEDLWSTQSGGKYDYDPVKGYIEKNQ